MRVLAIESSCDEFSVAIVEQGRSCIIMDTVSQIDLHAKYGGVIPELASREHTKYFTVVLKKILTYMQDDWTTIDAIAVTVGPGLSGSLLVGIQIAKTLAITQAKPLIPVQHILGHLFSVQFTQEMKYPYLGLVASGGHTELIYCENATSYQVIGRTRDDAVGEVYDKIAKKMQLPYPGGPIIDQLAQKGEPIYQFTTPKIDDPLAFSFSGVKSAVINLMNNKMQRQELLDLENIACSFQQFVTKELMTKLALASKKYPVKMIGVCGGVSANSALRKQIKSLQKNNKELEIALPELMYCGDNAAMIGAAASFIPAIYNVTDIAKLECYPNISVTDFYEKFMKKIG